MPVELPASVPDPTTPPSSEVLDRLNDDEIHSIIRWFREDQHTSIWLDFWLNEQSRRRTGAILEAIAIAAEHTSRLTAELGSLTRQGAEQNAEMVMLSRRSLWLTVANVLVAGAALAVSIVALAS
jgi:hypothetical protein